MDAIIHEPVLVTPALAGNSSDPIDRRPKPFGYNGAKLDLAKENCYKLFGFSSAKSAQDAFASLDWEWKPLGALQVKSVPGGLQAVGGKPPAQTLGSTVTINSDYNWIAFSSVAAGM